MELKDLVYKDTTAKMIIIERSLRGGRIIAIHTLDTVYIFDVPDLKAKEYVDYLTLLRKLLPKTIKESVMIGSVRIDFHKFEYYITHAKTEEVLWSGLTLPTLKEIDKAISNHNDYLQPIDEEYILTLHTL